MNYFIILLGQAFEFLGLLLSLPSCVCNDAANFFYAMGGAFDNNKKENEED